jgi:hypothetical protein
MTIWDIRTACGIPKATHTHSEYVICLPSGTMAARTRLIVTLLIIINDYLECQVYFSFIVLFNGAVSYWGCVASSVDE